MNKIIKKVQYSEKVFRFDVEAPLIAKSRKAGNFVIIRVDNNSERMPPTIADAITLRKEQSHWLCRRWYLHLPNSALKDSEGDSMTWWGPLGNPIISRTEQSFVPRWCGGVARRLPSHQGTESRRKTESLFRNCGQEQRSRDYGR